MPVHECEMRIFLGVESVFKPEMQDPKAMGALRPKGIVLRYRLKGSAVWRAEAEQTIRNAQKIEALAIFW